MISVKDLNKTFRIPNKKDGWKGAFSNFFARDYKEVTAISNISFDVGEGELVGLIGPNGAGKTTTMKILSGILYPTSGKVSVLGFIPWEKKRDFLKQIAFVMGQKNQLLWELPAYDSFILNKEIYDVSDAEFKKSLDELTELLKCKDLVKNPVKTLSLGQRMRMELIAALLHKPRVLFLDEPTIGLDVVAQKIIRDFLKEYQRRHKATILLTSHYMEDVKQLAQRVMVINFGKIIYDGALADLTKKYVKDKTITVILEEEVEIKTLKQISQQFEMEFPKVTFRVPRDELAEKVAQISRHLSYADITIEEERIEDVIRKIFQKK